MLVLEDVLEVDNLVGLVAEVEHGDLVENLHRAVRLVAHLRREFGRVLDPRFAVRALPHRGEQSAAKTGKSLVKVFGLKIVYFLTQNQNAANLVSAQN